MSDFKTWAERLKMPFPDRRSKLQHIASGPDNRGDVQAARRLLQKRRYFELTEDRIIFEAGQFWVQHVATGLYHVNQQSPGDVHSTRVAVIDFPDRPEYAECKACAELIRRFMLTIW